MCSGGERGDIGGDAFRIDRAHWDPELFPEGHELIDRGRSVHVRRDEEGMPALLPQEVGELGGGRGLPRSLEPGEDDDGRGALRARERCGRAAEHLDDRVVDDLDDLLRAGDRLEDALADRALANGGDELAHDPQVHVGFEERDANVA